MMPLLSCLAVQTKFGFIRQKLLFIYRERNILERSLVGLGNSERLNNTPIVSARCILLQILNIHDSLHQVTRISQVLDQPV